MEQFVSFLILENLIKKKGKPFSIPKMQDLLLKLEGFKYVSSFDLNMDYYHIKLCPFLRQLYTIVLPLGNFESNGSI